MNLVHTFGLYANSRVCLRQSWGLVRTLISKLESHKLATVGFNKVTRLLGALGLELVTRPKESLPTLNDLQEQNLRGR